MECANNEQYAGCQVWERTNSLTRPEPERVVRLYDHELAVQFGNK